MAKWLGYIYINDHMSGTQDVILDNCFVFELVQTSYCIMIWDVIYQYYTKARIHLPQLDVVLGISL